MALNISGNSTSLVALLKASKANDAFKTSLEHIATGRQINSAADDAAAMTIADRLKSRADAAQQQIDNASMDVSIAQVADGALGQMSEILQDIRTKTIAASSAAQSPDSLAAIQSDIQGSLDALKDIASDTSYNGQTLLDGSFSLDGFTIGSVNPSQLGSDETGFLSGIDVTTADGAQQALETIDLAMDQVSRIRSGIGSTQEQALSDINVLSTTRINLLSAESQIRDSDLAGETIEMNRNKILQQAAAYAAKQGQAAKQGVIDLIG